MSDSATPAREYEFYLRVFNSIFHISISVYYLNNTEKGAIYYVTITTVIASLVKIKCYFHVWKYEVFARKLTWYCTGFYIINCHIIHDCIQRLTWCAWGITSEQLHFQTSSVLRQRNLKTQLIHHENGTVLKHSSNWSNLKTPALYFSVDGKYFENVRIFSKIMTSR